MGGWKRFKESLKPVTGDTTWLTVVGVEHYTMPKRPGTLQVMREPHNPHDHNALAVYNGFRQAGYVSAYWAARYAPRMDAARIRSFTVESRIEGGNLRIKFPSLTHPMFGCAAPDPASQPVDLPPTHRAWGPRWGSAEVENEHKYRSGLHAAIRALGHQSVPDGAAEDAPACLIAPPRPGAPVKVAIERHVVGELATETEMEYRAALAELRHYGVALEVPARIWVIDGDGTPRGRVTLEMPHPETILLPPYAHPGRAAILPVGRKLQVTGEEDYLDILVEALAGAGEAWHLVSIHSVLSSPRSQKPVAEVRWGGCTIGRLSTAMSAHFTPVAERCNEEGKDLLACARIAGNALRADVEVYATKAGDLSDAWINANVGSATRGARRDAGMEWGDD